jgi:uncharacterized protein YprB with RNaseH-like and TPR domain
MTGIDAVPIEQLVGGAELATPHGSCFLARRDFDLTHWHGCLPVGSVLDQPPARWSRVLPDTDVGSLDWSQAVFLDTETTGLSSAAGACVFVVGIGFFEGGFRLEQYVMRSPGEETAMLGAAAARLAGCPRMVTFNGRAFDWPLLMDCWRRAGLQPPTEPPHLDLLLAARRQWRRRLPSCSLSSLEYHLLKVEREHDVPGHKMPELYWMHQQSGDGRLLRLALEHNATDILSLVTLAGYLGQMENQ